MTKLKYLTLLIIIFAVSCASTPEPVVEEPTEETVVEPTVEPEEETVVEPEPVVEEEVIEVEPEPIVIEEPVVQEPEVEDTPVYIPEPLDDTLLSKAKKEVFKAQQAKAQSYFPSRLESLKSKLSEATSLKDEDPDKARILLAEISIEAEQLTLDSLEALKVACINVLNGQADRLLKIKADKYTPKEYALTLDQKTETFTAFEEGDFSKSLALYRTAYTSQTNLYNSLSTNMGYIENLTRIINNYRAEGESIDVEYWAPAEYKTAVESYIESQNLLYKDYDAINGEASLRNTMFHAKKALAQAKINIEVAKTDEEIFNLMNQLEAASTLTVLDREDNIISPEEWEGDADLTEKPIEATVEKDEESGLKPIDLDTDVEVEYPILEGETSVLGIRETRRTLLAEAKDLWNLGIEARNSGDLEAAREYLAKAKVYLDEYKSMAVDYIYTVILNPERRDCLWRISEKEEFYGDPLLWQNIWERNKKLIQDPDLIYPGWKLIIPPID